MHEFVKPGYILTGIETYERQLGNRLSFSCLEDHFSTVQRYTLYARVTPYESTSTATNTLIAPVEIKELKSTRLLGLMIGRPAVHLTELNQTSDGDYQSGAYPHIGHMKDGEWIPPKYSLQTEIQIAENATKVYTILSGILRPFSHWANQNPSRH